MPSGPSMYVRILLEGCWLLLLLAVMFWMTSVAVLLFCVSSGSGTFVHTLFTLSDTSGGRQLHEHSLRVIKSVSQMAPPGLSGSQALHSHVGW